MITRGSRSVAPYHTVLCFVDGDWPILTASKEFEGVRLESERSIKKPVTGLDELDPAEFDGLTAILASALPSK